MNDLSGKELLKQWRERQFLGGTSQRQHAKELGIPFDVYHGKLYRAQCDEKENLPPEFSGFDRPSLYEWHIPGILKFNWNDFVVLGDVQLPTTDYDFSMLPALIAKRWLKSPRRLIIGGDFWNCDAFSAYKKVIPLPDWRNEVQAAKNILALWAETFDEMYMICGNHERRRLMWMEGEEDFQDIIAQVAPHGKVQASVMDRCEVKTENGLYNVLHGGSYRKAALSMADELAQKYQSHIISHHEHHAAMGMDRFDRYFVVNNGGLFDIKKMAYVQLVSTPRSSMSQGFTMVKDGFPYLFGKFSDWVKWL